MRERHYAYTVQQAKAKGIFCLETDWETVAKAPSVFSLLGILRSSPLKIPSIHRHIATQDSFHHYLRKWTQQQHRGYPVLYLALHGIEGSVQFGDLRKRTNSVTLTELEEELAGRCAGRIIHFGSCRTLIVSEQRLQKFLKITGAVAVSGYGLDIDWIRSAIFDLALLASVQQNAFTAPGMRAVRQRMKRRYGTEYKALRFRMTVRTGR